MTIQFNLKDDRSETVHYDFVEYPVRAQRVLLYGTFIVNLHARTPGTTINETVQTIGYCICHRQHLY